MKDFQRYYDTDLYEVEKIELDSHSKYLRRLIFRAVLGGGRGHIGPALSLVETIRVLYGDVLSMNPNNPKWEKRDRYILSKGHGCLALYAQLAYQGFFEIEKLDEFCRFNSILGGHPEVVTPGVEASTGALGHGMSIGFGIAMSLRKKKSASQVFIHVGDGEINEGSVWEAAAAASKYELGNYNVIIDYNKLQSAGNVSDVQPMEPLTSKWSSFGFKVAECNGHCIEELQEKLSEMKNQKEGPSVLIAHTVKGKGIPSAENNPTWHHKARLNKLELEELQSALGVTINA